MSILIKGMEMPKNCLVCPCTDTEYGECVLDPEKRCPENYGKIADWCPLVPVPEHGDLIDRKTAYDSLFNGMVMTGYQSRALDCICDFYVPTIIPADPADKEGEG